ncbi:MAG: hypothetical protein CEN92_251 [Candidatus Berkelbacteria bacterium Licking1014_96]|uniref:Uncharacterized protein n=1 Tax=Candidatus Berkelbacteria bacterium Licking1014_96 TaxID=2017149 RepID=A0A554LF42_9BACT|nr:MAG: hypothetical protein CEN92_251 [Candidatus Berkelbacteria bacterium Licking1014_96]
MAKTGLEPQWVIIEITVAEDREIVSFCAGTTTAEAIAQRVRIPPGLMLKHLIHRFEEEVSDVEFYLNAAKALVELVAPIKSGLRKVKG